MHFKEDSHWNIILKNSSIAIGIGLQTVSFTTYLYTRPTYVHLSSANIQRFAVEVVWLCCWDIRGVNWQPDVPNICSLSRPGKYHLISFQLVKPWYVGLSKISNYDISSNRSITIRCLHISTSGVKVYTQTNTCKYYVRLNTSPSSWYYSKTFALKITFGSDKLWF